MASFQPNQDASLDGTHYVGEIRLSPAAVVARFGEPRSMDEYKVSGEYRFIDGAGRTYALYDWKATSLYDDEGTAGLGSTMPTPEQFWADTTLRTLHVGGVDDADVTAFEDWLRQEVGA